MVHLWRYMNHLDTDSDSDCQRENDWFAIIVLLSIVGLILFDLYLLYRVESALS